MQEKAQNDVITVSLNDLKLLLDEKASGPSDNTLWNADDIAAYLRKKNTQTVRNQYLPRPDFPPAIRIEGGHPLYEPKDVKVWARRFKEKKKR